MRTNRKVHKEARYGELYNVCNKTYICAGTKRTVHDFFGLSYAHYLTLPRGFASEVPLAPKVSQLPQKWYQSAQKVRQAGRQVDE
jgi:hypothetical protein